MEESKIMSKYKPSHKALDGLLFNMQTLYNRLNYSVNSLHDQLSKLSEGFVVTKKLDLDETPHLSDGTKIGDLNELVYKCYSLANRNEKLSNQLTNIIK